MTETTNIRAAAAVEGWPEEAGMAICAIRYTLGRRSYVVSDGIRWAREYGRKYLAVRRTVIRDIEAAIEQKDQLPEYQPLGDEMDERGWRAVLVELKEMGDG